jgi:hypothetical protein
LAHSASPFAVITEAKFRFFVKRFWFLALSCSLRIERGELWFAHRQWSQNLLDILTRLAVWLNWDLACTVDPWMRGRRLESWATPEQSALFHGLVEGNESEGLVQRLRLTTLAFSLVSEECARRHGFQIPVCSDDAVISRLDRLARSAAG